MHTVIGWSARAPVPNVLNAFATIGYRDWGGLEIVRQDAFLGPEGPAGSEAQGGGHRLRFPFPLGFSSAADVCSGRRKMPAAAFTFCATRAVLK